MRIFIAVLLFITTAAYAEHAGRGLVRHSQPGITEYHEPLAEVVELKAPPVAKTVAAPAPLTIFEAAPPVFVQPVFVAAEAVPAACTPVRIPDAFQARAEIVEVASPPLTLLKAQTAKVEAIKTAEPTAEQLQMMRDFHLSSPPTILNADGSVKTPGRTLRGAAVQAPTVPYCPECQRRRGY